MSAGSEKPPWKKDKIWIAGLGILAVVGLFLGGAALGLSEEARAQAAAIVGGIVSFLLGAHGLSNAAHNLAQRPVSTVSTVVNEGRPAPAGENSTPGANNENH